MTRAPEPHARPGARPHVRPQARARDARRISGWAALAAAALIMSEAGPAPAQTVALAGPAATPATELAAAEDAALSYLESAAAARARVAAAEQDIAALLGARGQAAETAAERRLVASAADAQAARLAAAVAEGEGQRRRALRSYVRQAARLGAAEVRIERLAAATGSDSADPSLAATRRAATEAAKSVAMMRLALRLQVRRADAAAERVRRLSGALRATQAAAADARRALVSLEADHARLTAEARAAETRLVTAKERLAAAESAARRFADRADQLAAVTLALPAVGARPHSSGRTAPRPQPSVIETASIDAAALDAMRIETGAIPRPPRPTALQALVAEPALAASLVAAAPPRRKPAEPALSDAAPDPGARAVAATPAESAKPAEAAETAEKSSETPAPAPPQRRSDIAENRAEPREAAPDPALLSRQEVTAPRSGVVVFAGALTSHSHAVMIEPQNGVHIVISGLRGVAVAKNDRVAAGAAVGWTDDDAHGTPGARSVSVEVYRGGRSVDPGPWVGASWLAASEKRVSG